MATIRVTEQDGFLVLTFAGTLDSDADIQQLVSDVETAATATRHSYEALGHPIKIIADISEFKARASARAFEALVDLIKRDKDIVEKTAIIGGSSEVQALGQAAVYLSGRSNIRFFAGSDEARAWLND